MTIDSKVEIIDGEVGVINGFPRGVKLKTNLGAGQKTRLETLSEPRYMPETESKENFFVGWWNDSFNRKGDPDFSRKYIHGLLRTLTLGGIIFGIVYCNEKANMKKAEELPTKIVRFEEILNNKDFKDYIINHYVPSKRLQMYVGKEFEILKDGTIRTPYIPEEK